MFLIQVMGRTSKLHKRDTIENLGELVTKLLKSDANDAISVAVERKKDGAVMPYVWLRRDLDNDDQWEGEAGDSIKLGIDDGLIVETDPLEQLSLNQAIDRGIVTIHDEDYLRTFVTNKDEIASPTASSKKEKLSNEEKVRESKRMIDDMFTDIFNQK
jgi:hypothetical protein